eukprot:6203685-Pleurochrysis_carterae.AAC.1
MHRPSSTSPSPPRKRLPSLAFLCSVTKEPTQGDERRMGEKEHKGARKSNSYRICMHLNTHAHTVARKGVRTARWAKRGKYDPGWIRRSTLLTTRPYAKT